MSNATYRRLCLISDAAGSSLTVRFSAWVETFKLTLSNDALADYPLFVAVENGGRAVCPGLKTALSGGTSDARNSTIMKMFGLLDFGDRAGSGIPDLFDICKSELGTQPDYNVTYAPSRTILTIDISKMTQTERTINVDDKEKMDDNGRPDDKRTIKADDKRTKIIEYIRRNGEAKTEDLVKLLGSSTTRTKMLIYQLVDEGVLVSCGGNRNRTYKLRE